MLQKRFILTTALITILLVILMSAGDVSQAAQSQVAPIRLQADTFVPALGDQPDIPPGLTIRGYAAGQRGYYIVQFTGPVQQAWKNEVEAFGGEILDYIPDFAFKVRLNPAQAARVSDLDTVAWLGLFQPAYKINPDVELEGTNLYRVVMERGANRGQTTAAVVQSGAEILSREKDILLIAADASQLGDIAHILDVAWIEDFLMPQKHNEYGAGSILGANVANANGYDGSTQTVAVADTGFDSGIASDAHPDVPSSRITAIQNFQGASSSGCYTVLGDGAQDVDSGHGTHTALSVLGDGGASGQGKGVAPNAKLIFQAVEDYVDFTGICSLSYQDGYYLLGIPLDLQALYLPAYNAGARIHSNSWGSDAAGDYTEDSAATDGFIWNNPDQTITFSAGNAGTDANANGVVDDDSMGSPATAKNAITVGASENDRGSGNWNCDTSLSYTSCNGQNSIFTYGSAWPLDFPASPINNDASAGNAQQIAAFSSRGPTDDGRIKPDVVAPGTWVLSGYSDLYQQGYDGSSNPQNGVWQYDGWGFPYDQNYKYMGGTSMANPIVAGGAAVVRDFYQKTDSHYASAALVKATLINSAVDLLDENNDGVNDNDYPIPNSHEGWGRVDLAVATDGSHEYIDEIAGLNTGGSASYQYNVATAGSPFKVSLVWSDYASTAAAAQNLVNNLDLIVIAPGGATYKGNVFSGGWSQAGGSADTINNVENVYIQGAAAGTWTVEVSGANIPNGSQPFALVVDGELGNVDIAPSVEIVNPAEDAIVSGPVTIQISAMDSEDEIGSLIVEFSDDGNTWNTAAYNGISGYYEYPWDSTGTSEGDKTIYAQAEDSATNKRTDSNAIVVDNANDFPVASFSYNATGLVVSFTDQSTDSDPGGSVKTWDWDFGDGSPSSDQNSPTHPYATDGTYTVMLTVTDDRGGQDSISQDISVSQASNEVHVGDFAGSSNNNRKSWNAVLWITIHDGYEGPVTPATVKGYWSTDPGATVNCAVGLMGGESVCIATKTGIDKKQNSVIFTVTDITDTSLTYNEGANHDDTTGGKSIQINKDGTTEDPNPGNQSPTADFYFNPSSPAPNDLVTFTDASGDPDGSVDIWNWDFGDGDSSTVQNPSHTYTANGNYVVTLTVTDNQGANDSTNQTVIVSDGSVGDFTLTANGYKVKGVQHADLEWNPPTTNVAIFRDDNPIVPEPEITGNTYTDNIGNKGVGSYSYQVCEIDTGECSNVVVVDF